MTASAPTPPRGRVWRRVRLVGRLVLSATLAVLLALIFVRYLNSPPELVAQPGPEASASSSATPTPKPTKTATPTPTPTLAPVPQVPSGGGGGGSGGGGGDGTDTGGGGGGGGTDTGGGGGQTTTPTETPQPAVVSIDTFFADPTEVVCPPGATGEDVTIVWETSNATKVWFGVDTANAKEQPYQSYVAFDGSLTINFGCSESSHLFTLTAENDAGEQTSTSVQVGNGGFQP